MIKVNCYPGDKVKERPISFCLIQHTYEVKEIIDRWYGENSLYFKIKADDENIYLLKYDEWTDEWDLIFYQNPIKLNALMSHVYLREGVVSTGSTRNYRENSALLN